MKNKSRREFLRLSTVGYGLILNSNSLKTVGRSRNDQTKFSYKTGSQRLSLKEIRDWNALRYGMFLHFGMSTFVGREVPDGQDNSTVYSPDKLNVDQWIKVARDAGMRYAVLTTKHTSGHCLWPSKYTDYTIATSNNKTDVVDKFMIACDKYNIKAGLYYNCIDNHHKFGSKTLSDLKPSSISYTFPRDHQSMAPFTSSMYQNFVSDQLTELFTNYGKVYEIWIDNPGILGTGYRTFLYNHLADLQPQSVIMMGNYVGDGVDYNLDAAWPSDLIALKMTLPPRSGHKPWRKIGGKAFCIPAEVCNPIGGSWFYADNDNPKNNMDLIELYNETIRRNANLLLNVPPDKHGLITRKYTNALDELRKQIDL